MTLVIAGYLADNRVFFVADSTISQGNLTLLSGFRKIYEVSIKLWKPNFVGLYFNGYKEVYSTSICVVAFAGSTLVAQHVLNSISEHLGKLRITYRPETKKYAVLRHCQFNDLEATRGINEWSESMFNETDYKNIIDHTAIADVIEYSINESLLSARKYQLDENMFNSLVGAFVAAIECPVDHSINLHEFQIKTRHDEEGILQADTTKRLVPKSRVVTLGISDYETDAQNTFSQLTENAENVQQGMFTFLNEAIDEEIKKGSKRIDRPSILKVFDGNELRKISRKP